MPIRSCVLRAVAKECLGRALSSDDAHQVAHLDSRGHMRACPRDRTGTFGTVLLISVISVTWITLNETVTGSVVALALFTM